MSSHLEITIKHPSDLINVAKTLFDFFGDIKIVVFNAPMGAGKTTLIKEMCVALGCKNGMSSPTYSIVNEYTYPYGKIFHFDFYRLKNQEELLDIGIEDYLDSGHYCFIEWPELVNEMIAVNFANIEIEVRDNIRYLRATKN